MACYLDPGSDIDEIGIILVKVKVKILGHTVEKLT